MLHKFNADRRDKIPSTKSLCVRTIADIIARNARQNSQLRACNQTITGVKFLFRVTLRWRDLMAEIIQLREPDRLLLVLSQKEIKRVLTKAPSL